MNQMQYNVTETDGSSHVQDTTIKADVTLTDVAEDVDVAQPEVNTCSIEADAIVTYMGIAHTGKSAKRVLKVTQKRPVFPT